MLIVETADMLQAPLFTAEALLRAHGTMKHRNTDIYMRPLSFTFMEQLICPSNLYVYINMLKV